MNNDRHTVQNTEQSTTWKTVGLARSVVDAAGMETGYFIRCLSSSRQRTDGFYGASHHTELLTELAQSGT